MPALQTYAGDDRGQPDPIECEPSEAARSLAAAEAEIDRLKSILRHQEAALRIAGRVLLPYLQRAGANAI